MADISNASVNPNGTVTFIYSGQQTLFIPQSGLTGYNRFNNTAYGNITLISDPATLCNVNVCDLTFAHFDYVPNIGGNALYAAFFGMYLVVNIFLGIRNKAWGYMGAMLFGLVGEIIGYIARILLWQNPFDPTGNNFLIYLVCLTIAPAFLSAAIYLCLARVVIIYGEQLSRFRPRTYTLLFSGCDLLSLILQAAGGGIASGATSSSQDQMGINLMFAGLSAQVASLALFILLCGEFAYRLSKSPESWSTKHATIYNTMLFNTFLIGLCIATITILIRSAFRVAELSGGFRGPLANNEISFMILDGAMIVVACTCLTILHPGVAFQGSYQDADFNVLPKKGGSVEKVFTAQESLQNTTFTIEA